jgi:putative dimethyl sulfoxide reductase chaperone
MKKPEHTIFSAFSIVLTFLSRVYLETVDAALMHYLKEQDLFSHWPLPVDAKTGRGLGMLRTFVRQWTPEHLAEMNQDYTRLFIGLEHTLAPPYASVYLGKEKIIFDIPTLDIRDLYRRYGLVSRTTQKEPDDHIGLELSFLQYLCQQAAASEQTKSTKNLVQELSSFLDGHLNKWLPDFLELVMKHADTEFYAGIADVTEGTAASLQEVVSLLGKNPMSS